MLRIFLISLMLIKTTLAANSENIQEPTIYFEEETKQLKRALNVVMANELIQAEKVQYFKADLCHALKTSFNAASHAFTETSHEAHRFAAANLLISTYHVLYAVTRPEVTAPLHQPKISRRGKKYAFAFEWMERLAISYYNNAKNYPFLYEDMIQYPLFSEQTTETMKIPLKIPCPFIEAILFFKNHKDSSKCSMPQKQEVELHLSNLEKMNTPWAKCALADAYIQYSDHASLISKIVLKKGAENAIQNALQLCPNYEPAKALDYRLCLSRRLTFEDFATALIKTVESCEDLTPDLCFAKFKLLSAIFENRKILPPILEKMIRDSSDETLKRAAFLGHPSKKSENNLPPTQQSQPPTANKVKAPKKVNKRVCRIDSTKNPARTSKVQPVKK